MTAIYDGRRQVRLVRTARESQQLINRLMSTRLDVLYGFKALTPPTMVRLRG